MKPIPTERLGVFFEDILDDWAPIDVLLWDLGFEGGRGDRAAALDALDALYRSGFVVPGDLLEQGLQVWPGGVDEWVRHSEERLDEVGWDPRGGSFWLDVTEDGRDFCAAHVKGENIDATAARTGWKAAPVEAPSPEVPDAEGAG